MFWKREKFIAPVGIQTLDHSAIMASSLY